MTLTETRLNAADGYPIATRWFEPERPPRGAMLIAPAIGVPQSYYASFARWAASQGLLVATFDYRGIGDSAPASLRGFQASVFDWARLDAQAVLDALAARAPETPVTWVGHSMGGQLLPFLERGERIERAITVATGSGYWRENSPPLKRRVWLLWYLVAPITLPLFGYFPGRRLNMVGDLPRPLMAQWRRWCLHPDYVAGVEPGAAERYAAVRTPIVSLSFTDDEMMSARNTEAIHDLYLNAPQKRLRLSPREAGLARIGHFGFFRQEHRQALWSTWLLPEVALRDDTAALER